MKSWIRNLTLFTLIICCFTSTLSAQKMGKVAGKLIDRDEGKLITWRLIQIESLELDSVFYSQGRGGYELELPSGPHTLIFAGEDTYLPLRQEILIEAYQTIDVDIILEKATDSRIYAAIPAGQFPEKLQGKWRIKKVIDAQGQRYGMGGAGMSFSFRTIEGQQHFGAWTYETRCRGEFFRRYCQLKEQNSQELLTYSTYKMLAHTTELRSCDRQHLKQKKKMLELVWKVVDAPTISIDQKANGRKMLMNWAGHTVLLKKLKD